MKNILLFEPFASGHRILYVRYLMDAIERRGGIHVYLAVGTTSLDHPQVTQLRSAHQSCLTIVPVDANEGVIAARARRLGRFRGALKFARQRYWVRVINDVLSGLREQTEIAYLFIPFVDDYCLYVAAGRERAFGRTPWGGIVIRPRHHLRACGVEVPFRWVDLLDRMAYQRLLSRSGLTHLFSIDPYICRYYAQPKLSHIPDPADLLGPHDARLPPELSVLVGQGRTILLIYGYIDGRKGLDTLLPAALDPSVPQDLHIVVAGRQNPDVRPALASSAAASLRRTNRLTEIDREISDAEEAALFRFADIVWVYYPRSYCSSGVLVRAGQCAKPVIATREGLVGRLVADLGMGQLASETKPDEVRTALAMLSSSAETRKVRGRAGFDYFSGATTAAFSAPVVSHIASVIDV